MDSRLAANPTMPGIVIAQSSPAIPAVTDEIVPVSETVSVPVTAVTPPTTVAPGIPAGAPLPAVSAFAPHSGVSNNAVVSVTPTAGDAKPGDGQSVTSTVSFTPPSVPQNSSVPTEVTAATAPVTSGISAVIANPSVPQNGSVPTPAASPPVPQIVGNAAEKANPTPAIQETKSPALSATSVSTEPVSQAAQPVSEAVAVSGPAPNVRPAGLDAVQTQQQLERLRTVGPIETAPKARPSTTETAAETKAVSSSALPVPQAAKPVSFAPSVQTGTPANPVSENTTVVPFGLPLDALNAVPNETLSGLAVVGIVPRTVENSGGAGPSVPSVGSVVAAANSVVQETAVANGTGGHSQGEGHASGEERAPSGETAEVSAAKPDGTFGAGGVTAGSRTERTGSASPAAPFVPLDRTKLLAQIDQHLETLRFAKGRDEIAFHLTPDNLGSLHIAVTTGADGVIARVTAEHAGVRQALEGAKEHLRSALENRGLHLDKLEISVTQGGLSDGRTASQSSAQQQAFQQERTNFGRGTNGHANRFAEIPVEAAAVPVAAISSSQSRLDYRA